jgi:hypothetical protein
MPAPPAAGPSRCAPPGLPALGMERPNAASAARPPSLGVPPPVEMPPRPAPACPGGTCPRAGRPPPGEAPAPDAAVRPAGIPPPFAAPSPPETVSPVAMLLPDGRRGPNERPRPAPPTGRMPGPTEKRGPAGPARLEGIPPARGHPRGHQRRGTHPDRRPEAAEIRREMPAQGGVRGWPRGAEQCACGCPEKWAYSTFSGSFPEKKAAGGTGQ